MVVQRHTQRLRAAATQPRFGETGAERIIISTVSDCIDRQFLAIAYRQRLPCFLVENIADREIIQRQAYLANQHSAAISTLQLNLTGVAFFHLVDNVHRAILCIGLHIGLYGLLFEITQRGQLAMTPDNSIAAEKVAWASVQLPEYYAVVSHRVAFNDNVAHTGLLAFHYADFYVDRIILNANLYRCGREKEIAVVHIHGTDVRSRRVVLEIGLQKRTVIRVAFLYAEMLRQQIGGINSIARKRDVAEHKPVSLMYLNLNNQTVLICILPIGTVSRRIYCVPHYAGISETVLVIISYNAFQVLVKLRLLVF